MRPDTIFVLVLVLVCVGVVVALSIQSRRQPAAESQDVTTGGKAVRSGTGTPPAGDPRR